MIPDWMGLWFAVFPTAETLAAQVLAAALVVGSLLARASAGARAAGRQLHEAILEPEMARTSARRC